MNTVELLLPNRPRAKRYIWARPFLRPDGKVYVWHAGQWWKAAPDHPLAEAYRQRLERMGEFSRGMELYRLRVRLGMVESGTVRREEG